MPSQDNGVALRKSFAKLPEVMPVPSLIKVQLDSFHHFQEEGLKELFEGISPIKDFTENRLELHFLDYEFRAPQFTELECRARDMSYAAPLYVKAMLVNKETGEKKEQWIFFGDFPIMTDKGTFVISGAERVVVSQLLRSPGVYFTTQEDLSTGRLLAQAKLIPERGAWLEFETSGQNAIVAKVDGKRKIPITTLLRAMDLSTDAELEEAFRAFQGDSATNYIRTTIDRDPLITGKVEALLDIYARLRPGDPPNADNAQTLIHNLFFNPRRYDLGRVGRYKLNKKLEKVGLNIPLDTRVLTRDDFVAIARQMILINNGKLAADDIDHLGNRRARTVGHLIQNQFHIGLLRLEKTIKERMSIVPPEQATPTALINIRPVVAAIREFFGGSQLSQFMDQTNPLAELTHKRRLSAMGPGGLSRERAGFDVRDVHHSHYGRICPIETPEGPNIGLIGSLAIYGSVNDYGFIETPYRRVINAIANSYDAMVGQTIREDVATSRGNVIAEDGEVVNKDTVKRLLSALPAVRVVPLKATDRNRTVYVSEDLSELEDKKILNDVTFVKGGKSSQTEEPVLLAGKVVSKKDVTKIVKSKARVIVDVVPFVSNEVRYLAADREEDYTIAQANAPLNERNEFVDSKVEVRRGSKYFKESTDKIDFMDVSPKQVFSVAAALIPFLEHDDANRALMGSNMQRQAVPLLRPEAPLIATGMEREVARYSGQVVFARADGEVISATGDEIVVTEIDGNEHVYHLQKFIRTNQGTCVNQRPVVSKGDRVTKGQVLADSSATDHGELALGQNIICAFMSWRGYNYEDAIVISERLVRDDKFTSIHIEKHEVEARQTKLGDEEITRDIPNVGEESLRNLDQDGIIRIGAEVEPGDILVGKITPKGETELTAEEKLLRAIFGEKAREVKDSSLRVPHGEWGKVIDVKISSREDHSELPPGVNKLVRVWVAQKRKVSVGDKMAGRHGNKGVISRVLPVEDMPFLPDGRPVEIVLNPIGVPSRMNIGQVLEAHLGWSAETLGFRVLNPIFDGANDTSIEDSLGRAWLIQRFALQQSSNGDALAEAIKQVKDQLVKRGFKGLEEKVFDDASLGTARIVCLRLWLEDQGVSTKKLSDTDVEDKVERLYRERRLSPPIFGKVVLRDGQTGNPFDNPVTVGNIYMMKLIHLVEDKIHARSTGPYSLITQQPLGGKAQFGGQRFGEMEVWALEAYGAAHVLQELLTVKSDDVSGRAKTYEAIVKGDDIIQPGVPESFKVLFMELRSLGLAVELLNEEEEKISFLEDRRLMPRPRL
ncbi:MAG: DNA-directed RNA polymerase subunit beta [Chloroflexota bacterium]